MQKTCHQCQASFTVTDDDLKFYDAVSPVIAGKKFPLPPPDGCPDCRYRQRLTWRNERNLYRRKCAATGEDIVSIFSPDKTWPPVYKQDYWWSDKWDPKQYGREMDFSRPFFEQWVELFRVVPQIAMNNQMSENCEYTNQSQRNKDCYMILCANDSRDCLHGMWFQKCNNCVDCLYLEESELSYQVVNGKNCYHCNFSQNLENCSDVLFSQNCIGCKHCLGCINLRNKEYYIWNEKHDKDSYEKKIAAMQLDKHSSVISLQKEFEDFRKQFPRKYYVGANGENFSGDYLLNVKNSFECYNCRDTEEVVYSQDVWRARHCQDMTETVDNDFSYSIEGCAITSNSLFTKKTCDIANSLYSSHCHFSKNCFGCVAVKHGKYCVLNKQYTKDEYEALLPRLIAHMEKTNEWGRHFPPGLSCFGYNESVAQEYFPLSKDEAVRRGYRWSDYEYPPPDVKKIIPAAELPDSIDQVTDELLTLAIECEATKKPFRIIKQELDFYRRQHLPLPHLHPDERHRRRMALRNPRHLWQRQCMKCSKDIQTTFARGKRDIVYCERCYLETVH